VVGVSRLAAFAPCWAGQSGELAGVAAAGRRPGEFLVSDPVEVAAVSHGYLRVSWRSAHEGAVESGRPGLWREGMLGVPARVVVVDDDEALRNAVRRALGLEGYEVELAGDGAEALTCLAGARADLVVLDVLMPVLDGITVCRRLREGGDRTPILMLTARDAVSDRVVGLDAGADDYLTKPFALEELLARVRALLRRSARPAFPQAKHRMMLRARRTRTPNLLIRSQNHRGAARRTRAAT